MNIRLEDIIDLEYLIGKDEALSSEADIRAREEKDKKIFEQCRKTSSTDKELLVSWLGARRQEMSLLPGRVFALFYSAMVYAMIFLGGITGLSFAWTFLAYHGTRPVNVALFFALFIVLQVVLITLTVFFLIRRCLADPAPRAFLPMLFFDALPAFLKKINRGAFKKGAEALEHISALIRIKNQEYGGFFFRQFFILTSIFSFSFATSSLAGTLFRVIVSDMAFGWQSTLMTTSAKIHQMVSFIALPWSWFVPETLAYPSLEQIEGSRIILKDGISVLATGDLVSWWPFLCLGILFYAVFPRAVLMIAGIMAQNRALRHFDLDRPVFRQLLIRMKSAILDIGPAGVAEKRGVQDQASRQNSAPEDQGQKPSDSEAAAGQAFVLAPGTVYADAALEKIKITVQGALCADVKETLGITLDPEADAGIFDRIRNSDTDQVVLVHEAWQPPIRGLLYYIRQLKSALPQKGVLWVLLTGDAGQENLCMDDGDADFDIWKKALFKLQDPGIRIMRQK